MKISSAVAGLACLACCATAQAGLQDIRAANNQLMVQYIKTNVDYAEYGNGFLGTSTGLLDSETGGVPGMALSLVTMHGEQDGYIAAQYSRNDGSTTYTGALIGGGPYGSVVGSSTASLADFSLRLGKGLVAGGQAMLTPYLEFGRHQWDRGVNYGELYTHYYYGIGLLGQYAPAPRVVLAANVLVGETSSAYITVNSGPGLNGFAGALGSSSLSRIGLSADYAFTPGLHGNIGVDFTRFKYGMSAAYPVGGGFVAWEPDSTTKYTTVRFGLGFAF